MVDVIEGIVIGTLWYHYDRANDVLYLRLARLRNAATYAEEDDNGILVLRCEQDDAVAGMTVVNWWKRFGRGAFPDSLPEIDERVEHWAAPRFAATGTGTR